MFSYDICVARYSENLDWLQHYKKDAVVYNKTTDLDESEYKKVVPIEAIGLETYSYFSYIIDHYDDLPDVVAFIQGRIDDHLGDIKNTHSVDDKKNPIVLLNYILKQAYTDGISAPLDETIYNHTNWRLSTPDRIPNKECKVCEYDNITDWWENYVGLKWAGPSRCTWCQIFAVRKDNILKHTKEKYQYLKNDPEFKHPYVEVTHFWERMLFPFFANEWR